MTIFYKLHNPEELTNFIITTKQISPLPSRLLGVDFGEKKVGIAVCDENWMIASPVKIVTNAESLSTIAQLIKEHKCRGIIMGLPLASSGEQNHLSQKVVAFAEKLAKLTHLPIAFYDERYSTKAVHAEFTFATEKSRKANSGSMKKNAQTRKDAKLRSMQQNDDALAAAYILQSALELLIMQK